MATAAWVARLRRQQVARVSVLQGDTCTATSVEDRDRISRAYVAILLQAAARHF
jgi:hypothetical protein